MQGTAEGVSLEDMRQNYADKPLSRRTAERLRDAVERLFPQMEHANPGELPKRWRLPRGTLSRLISISAEELTDLNTAVNLLRRENMGTQAENAELTLSKLRALIKGPAMARIDPDFEALMEAQGLALRPGPRPAARQEVVENLRQAILATRKVKIHYLYRGSGKRGFETVHPYGFLYGNRHYLVAWSENERAQDFRNYALSNIERVEILEKAFKRREFSLEDYVTESFGVFREEPCDVVWRFTPEAAVDAREFFFHPTQSMEEQNDGSLIVRFRAGGKLEMCWHLFTWGSGVKVVEPNSLKESYDELCSNLTI